MPYHLTHFKDAARLALDVGNSKHRGFWGTLRHAQIAIP